MGAGRIGGNCATQLAKGGHEVKLSGRDPSKLEPLVAEIGDAASVGTPAEAAEFGEVVVIAVPWDGFDDAVASAGSLDGKIVIDTTNQYGSSEMPGEGETGASFHAARVPGARYTKSFNTLTSAFQAEAAFRPEADRVVQWVCGDDEEAKNVVDGTDRRCRLCASRRRSERRGRRDGGAPSTGCRLRRGVQAAGRRTGRRGRQDGGGDSSDAQLRLEPPGPFIAFWGGMPRKRDRVIGMAEGQGVHPTQDPDPPAEQELRVRHRLGLEFGSRQEWDDPTLEWRRLFSEVFGTFLLVFVAAGGGLLHAQGQISLAAAVVAPGLMVMAIILFMGAVSGAHLNPAVSLAFAMRGDFPWRRVPGYIIVQLLGATLAALFLLAVFGNVGHLGATLPGPGYADWQALLMEVALTAGLVSVILGTASAAQNIGAIAALGVGGYIALAGLWAAPVSGVSMNPARSFGPALVGGDFSSYWVYVVGPLAGALIAVGFAYILRGPGGDPVARAAGSGVLERLEERMEPGRGHRT